MDWRRHAFNYEGLRIGEVLPERVKFVGVQKSLVLGSPFVKGYGGDVRDGDSVVGVAMGEIGGVC